MSNETTAQQATICMLCQGRGVMLSATYDEVPCERCKGTGIVWLRVAPSNYETAGGS